MDPTAIELATFASVGIVATWAGLTGMADRNTVGGSLFEALGLTTTQAPRIIGIIPEADFTAALQSWRIPRLAADGTPLAPPDRAPTMAELGQATLFGRACRISAGNGDTLESLRAAAKAAGPPPANFPSPATGSRRLKMSAIASHFDDTEFDMAPEQELMRCFKRYEMHLRPWWTPRPRRRTNTWAGECDQVYLGQRVATIRGLWNFWSAWTSSDEESQIIWLQHRKGRSIADHRTPWSFKHFHVGVLLQCTDECIGDDGSSWPWGIAILQTTCHQTAWQVQSEDLADPVSSWQQVQTRAHGENEKDLAIGARRSCCTWGIHGLWGHTSLESGVSQSRGRRNLLAWAGNRTCVVGPYTCGWHWWSRARRCGSDACRFRRSSRKWSRVCTYVPTFTANQA